MTQASRLSSLLVRDGIVHVKRMEQAFQRQVIYGGALDTILLEMGAVEENRLLPYLSLSCGLPPADDELLAPFRGKDPDPRIQALCPQAMSDEFEVVPLGFDGDALRIIVTDPVDMGRLEGFATRLRTPVQPFVAAEYRYHVLREQLYGEPTPSRFAQLATKHDAALVNRRSEPRVSIPPPPEPSTVEPAPQPVAEPAPAPAPVAVAAEPAPAPAAEPAKRHTPSTPLAAEQAPIPVRFDPSPMSVAEATDAPARSTRRDEIFATLLRAARTHTWYAGLLIVRGGEAIGRMAIEGRRTELEDIARVRIPLDSPSAFSQTVESASPYMGPVRTDREATNDVLRLMGGVVPPAALLLPVVLRNRVIALLYAHRGADSLSIGEVAGLLPLAGDAAMALSKIIIRAKTEPPETRAAVAEAAAVPSADAIPQAVTTGHTTDPWPAGPPPPPAVAPVVEIVAEPPSSPVPVRAPARMQTPAPVLAPIARLLDLIEAGQEPTASIARDEAARRADELMPEVERRFPGRLTVDRHHAGGGTLRAAQHGPLLGFLVELGSATVPFLRETLRSGDREKRYYAALALGETRDPLALRDLVDLVFEVDYGVRGAALDSILAFPAALVDKALETVRHAILQPPPRSRAAAYALGELRDVKSVPLLIDALGADAGTVDEAHRALVQISKQDFGTKVKKWESWWDENQGRARVEWMIDGLVHGDEPVRRSAIDELRRLTGETFGYRHDQPKRDRERARKAWLAWWDETGRKRFG